MSAVAVVQTAFIGDVVLATPLLEAARAAYPGETVVAVVRKGCENILGNNPFVDEAVVWDKHGADKGLGGMMRVAKRLKELSVHTAVVPHRSIRTALMLAFSGVKKRIGFDKGGGAFLHSVRVPYRRGIHEVERNLMLAEAAGWPHVGFRPALFPDERDRLFVDEIIAGMGRFCVLAPGSVWETKKWPADYYVKAGNEFASLGFTVFLSGGMDDEPLCRLLADNITGSISTCGMLTLRQSAELYRRSSFVLTGDSAPQHIAAAAGAAVFSIFGPTVRDFGFTPYSNRGYVIEESIECRPCGIHGHRACPESHHRCMRAITPDAVVSIVSRQLGF